MTTLLLVMLGSGTGAAARWWVDQIVSARLRAPLPLGTMLVNVSGSALLGLLLGAVSVGAGSPELVALVGTGLCGGFTTYSTFAFETVRLTEDGRDSVALTNVIGSIVAGLTAAALGWMLGAALAG